MILSKKRGVAAPAGGDSCLLAGGDDGGAAYLDSGADPLVERASTATGRWSCSWSCRYLVGPVPDDTCYIVLYSSRSRALPVPTTLYFDFNFACY